MRVLYFSPRDCWPAITGARLRDFHLARQLAGQAAVTYLGFARGGERRPGTVWHERLEALHGSPTVLVKRESGPAALNLVRGFFGPIPYPVLKYTSPAMLTELRAILAGQPFDAVQMEGVHLSAYAPHIRRLAPRARLVCDWHNIESELLERYAENAGAAKRLYARRTAALMRRLEDQMLALCDVHTVPSERERGMLLERAPGARIAVVGNGVDVEYFAEPSSGCDTAPRSGVVFMGSMDYHANIDAVLYFARDIWPQIHARRPGLRFVIVGSHPVRDVEALRGQPGITVTGKVDDIRPFYRAALAAVVPLRAGSGTRLKVLEAMAAGVPVVSTTLGAEGLSVEHGRNILIADTPAAIASAVIGLEAGSPEWHSLAGKARRLVGGRYDWPILGETLRQVYAEQLGIVWV